MEQDYKIGLMDLLVNTKKVETDRYSLRKRLEYYLPQLRVTGQVQYHLIDEAIARRHIADFYGLLQTLNIPWSAHWAVMRVNRLHSPTDFNQSVKQIIIPDLQVLNSIIAGIQSNDQAKFRKRNK